MTHPNPPHPQTTLAFDLPFLRARARESQLTDDELTTLTGIPTTDWDPHLTPQTLNSAALLALAHALHTPPESLLRQPDTPHQPPHRSPQHAPHAAILHAALIETGRIHPDDLASALEWDPTRLKRAAATLKTHLHQANSPQRLIHTDTAIHLAAQPGLLTARQLNSLYRTGHTAAALSPGEATTAAHLLHCTAHALPLDLPAEQIPRLTNRRLLAPTGPPAPHPDLLFALGLTASPMTHVPAEQPDTTVSSTAPSGG
ncbi:hypothetical protein [Streptomyces diastatochromogenes]|uniref:Uncharacterized protein n=1 Tax=Streptomyces diastatochromogenes TaxID=42236 RepID=A0A233SY07_STRDA|nr:hypothetical protein [Streptomyces diastatochromogenes]MCZ0991761.1 hypothetical protein [Streptomyces diastatochromogenes]OXZ00530.1 hypothetical protein BEK98_00195 [Streptomyces diastatochromogenes]